ncbi:hypothetical protein PHAVU_008G271600 [Phaseolus vulgaris]|uniref:pectinesterase n=1 Tax=Phaseolus vulgaris TaxID=3885 RepID=V7BBT8_PHAVU|nr:hypothetical protein PHAVU_008G271600g [Phaseolus vulgaris]ESW14328.1 hypothetical protein PHAVU_008G271600g [Phaseolus vulgaris]
MVSSSNDFLPGKHISNTITVNPNGKKAFKTIQDAINSVKNNNDKWVKIHIKAGLYIERPKILIEKPCIILQGEGSQNTLVSFSAHNGTNDSSTFISSPPNVIITGITFKNLYTGSQALAASIYGDKTFIYKCSFMGYQDTLYDANGRHYIKDCIIEGEIDFIFGDGQSYYENCDIKVIGRNPKVPGYVTAQGRTSSNDLGGFVFEGGSIGGKGKVNLGRAWRPFARVIFHKTYFDSVVTPQGWVAWTASGNENRVTYAEVDCKGPGADSSKRVSWMKKLSSSDLKLFSFPVFINNDRWFDTLPTIS